MSKQDNRHFTTQHRNAAVLKVLQSASGPLSPTMIADQIKEPWCCYGNFGCSAPISPVLKRIGAIKVGPGKYVAPEPQQ